MQKLALLMGNSDSPDKQPSQDREADDEGKQAEKAIL